MTNQDTPNAPSSVSVVGKPDAATGIFRHGFGLKAAVQEDISGDYFCTVVEELKANDYHLEIGDLQVFLAREFGFCYGVDKAVDYAYQTRRRFPDRRIFLTTEIIHNPRVNRRLLEMGIGFLTGQYKENVGYNEVEPDDVVILPAFGASIREVEILRTKGCTIVDTTCGSVVHVWKRVEKYAREGFTSVIHGKASHEETIGTSSRVLQFPQGHYLIVRDKEEAQLVCDFIVGSVPAQVIQSKFATATSPGFDPERDLQRIGVANQTTMLSSESLEIAAMIRTAMEQRYGAGTVAEHFRNFDTICSATQERQDAVKAFSNLDLNLILVIGGFNSSNTSHLIEIATGITKAYHIEDASQIVSRDEIVHRNWQTGKLEHAADWLPKLPMRLGLTAGASTPNRVIGEVLERVADLCGLTTNHS